MPTETRNSHGLFDAPIRFADKETIALSKEDIERQLDAGAFMMSRDDAIQAEVNEQRTGRVTVIATIEMDATVSPVAVQRIEPRKGWSEQRCVMPIGPGNHQMQRNASSVS